MRRALLLTAIAAGLVLPAALAARTPVKSLVLHRGDLPGSFSATHRGEFSAAVLARARRIPAATFVRHGFVVGYRVYYARSPYPKNLSDGALQIDSFVIVFKDRVGSTWDLAHDAASCSGRGAVEQRASTLGDAAARVCVVTRAVQGTRYRSVDIRWRHGPLLGAVLVAGLARGVSTSQAMALARKQEARFRASGR